LRLCPQRKAGKNAINKRTASKGKNHRVEAVPKGKISRITSGQKGKTATIVEATGATEPQISTPG